MLSSAKEACRAVWLRHIGLFLLLTLYWGNVPVFAAGPVDSLRLAPVNPAFINHPETIRLSREDIASEPHAGVEPQLGFLPSPLDLSHINRQPAPRAERLLSLPSSFDLRSQGKLSPVKNQGGCGACWTFATYGSLESNLLPSALKDFSENHLKNTHGFDWGHCSGGNASMAMAYLARWSGAVNESTDVYNAASSSSPSGLMPNNHIQQMLIIPDRNHYTDNDLLKQAVVDYGGVFSTMYYQSGYYHSSNYAYYFDGQASSNHAIVIVGWDDNFDRNRFPTPAPGNGAFIIRNSWGASWGENGYFYISYYDTNIGSYNYVFSNAEEADNHRSVYQYDPLGWTVSMGYGDPVGWFANIFTANSTETLNAVSFYVASLGSSYELFVYRDVGDHPIQGSLAQSQTGTLSFPGYHTIALSSPVSLSPGQKFSAVVKLTTPGFNYPIATEHPLANYSSQTTAHPGESFVSSDGNTWSDLTTYFPSTNVCLKAFTAGGSSGVREDSNIDWKIVGQANFGSQGNSDILWHHQAVGHVYVWYMDGANFRYDQYVRTVEDTNWRIVGVGDFNRDGQPDIVWHHQVSGHVYIWYMNGGTFLYDQYVRTVEDTNWRVVGVGDLNRDGQPDIVWHHQTTGHVYIWYMNGETFLYDQYVRTVEDVNWKLRGLGDWNRDGQPDIIWHHQISGDIYIWYMNGGAFMREQYIRTVR